MHQEGENDVSNSSPKATTSESNIHYKDLNNYHDQFGTISDTTKKESMDMHEIEIQSNMSREFLLSKKVENPKLRAVLI